MVAYGLLILQDRTGPDKSDERLIIERDNSNKIAPANLARRGVQFPHAAAQRNNRRQYGKSPSIKRQPPQRVDEAAFVVEVKRKWNHAKQRLLRGLGLYSQVDEIPLGLVVDCWI